MKDNSSRAFLLINPKSKIYKTLSKRKLINYGSIECDIARTPKIGEKILLTELNVRDRAIGLYLSNRGIHSVFIVEDVIHGYFFTLKVSEVEDYNPKKY